MSNVIGAYADPAAETDDWADDFILEQGHSPSGDSSVYTSEALSPTVFDNDAQASLDEDDSEQVSTEKLISDTSSKRNSLDKQKEAIRNSIRKNAETSPRVTTRRSTKIASSPRRSERVAKRLPLNDNDGSSNATNRDDDSSLTDSDEDVDRTSDGIKRIRLPMQNGEEGTLCVAISYKHNVGSDANLSQHHQEELSRSLLRLPEEVGRKWDTDRSWYEEGLMPFFVLPVIYVKRADNSPERPID